MTVRSIEDDPLRHVAAQLEGGDLACFRLVCTAFRAHSAPPAKVARSAFTRTVALVSFAWEALPGFRALDGRLLALTANAAFNGRLAVLRWLHEHGCPWDEHTCAHAAGGGQLETLRWLHATGCPWDEDTCYRAAEEGHLEVLQWACVHGCPWDEDTCSSAAEGGHLEVLRWAREHGCPWDEDTCSSAALGGHLEVLRWVRKHGYPWDERTCAYAAFNDHMEVLREVGLQARLSLPCLDILQASVHQ